MKAMLAMTAVGAALATGLPAAASADSGPPAAIQQYVEVLPSAGAPPKSKPKPKPPAATESSTTTTSSQTPTAPTPTSTVPAFSTTPPTRPKKPKPHETALERAGAAGKGLRILVTEPDLRATTVEGALDPTHARELRLPSAGSASVLSGATSDSRIVGLAIALLVATIAFAVFARTRSPQARA